MLTQAQTAGQSFTNDEIKEMTRKVSDEVDLVHQQTQNQRYGCSHIGATAKDISNVVRSEERFSRNAETDLVCRLLLEKKNGAMAKAGNGIFVGTLYAGTSDVSDKLIVLVG